jgi:flagellar hook-associated protein 2
MATITSLGVGSGLDLNTIVTQLVALERKPLQQMQQKASDLNSKISLYGTVTSLFSSLQTASNKLTDPALWRKAAVSSGDTTVVAAVGSDGAAAGNYAVTVQALASNQTVASATASSAASDLVGAGTLTLELGTWSADSSAFQTKAGGSPLSLEITASDTLSSVRDKINAAGAGVTASLINDTSGVRLSVRSDSSGAANGFRLAVSDADGSASDSAGLSRFAYDPAAAVNGLALKQPAANAQATVNGIALESDSNDISGAITGLTLNLRKVSSTPVNITATRDRESVLGTIKSFAEAYNALASYLNQQTKYDVSAKTGGPLQGDSAATGLQAQLRSVLNTASGASPLFARLSNLGLESQRDGTLTINQTKLDAAGNDLDELKKAFATTDSAVPANNGFARRFSTLAGQVLDINGTLTTRTQGLQKQVSRNDQDQANLNDRVDQFQKRLVAQYTALDSNIAKLNSLSSYVTQQLAQMNKTTTN